MKTEQTLAGGIALGVGALLMYALDPERGARRRARTRDQLVRAAHKTGDAAAATTRDLRNRLTGATAEARARLSPDGTPNDEVLVARVRSNMGRSVSHPRAIDVTADDGRVTLSGPILAREVDGLLRKVGKVRGVQSIENRLDVHSSSDGVSALQGNGNTTSTTTEFAQAHWSPAARIASGLAGTALVTYGVRQRGALGYSLGAVGAGLVARGLTNLQAKRLTGVGAGRQAVVVHKTIHITAPVEDVFGYWSNLDNFPLFMRNVRNVEDLGEGRTHWTVAGPAGTTVEWDAETTKWVDNEVIAWKSLPGAVVASAGVVRFEAVPDGTTRVQIRLSYNPPAGAVGHVVASLFGADPKTEMDEDLLRMKTMIETGHVPRDAADPLLTESKATR